VIFIVGFELGVIRGYDNVRSAHIQLPYRLAIDLDARGYKVILVTNRIRENLFFFPPEISHIPIRYISDPRVRGEKEVMHSGHSSKVSLLNSITSAMQLQRLIKLEKASVVHFCHGVLGVGMFAALTKILSRRKKILWTPTDPFLVRSFVLAKFLAHIDGIVSSTEYLSGHLNSQGLRSLVIKHGVSRELALENNIKSRVTFWRDPSFENGADIAFAVFKRLAVIFPQIKFTMMVRPHWNSLIEDSDIDNLEIYSYPYPNGVSLEGVLSETLVCYFPFRKLSTNPQLCILESLVSGIPCIVSNVGSVPEYVLDENCLLEDNTVDSAIEKISSLLKSPDGLGRPTSPVTNGFHWESFVDDYISIYGIRESNVNHS